jgi:hypothetical protein
MGGIGQPRDIAEGSADWGEGLEHRPTDWVCAETKALQVRFRDTLSEVLPAEVGYRARLGQDGRQTIVRIQIDAAKGFAIRGISLYEDGALFGAENSWRFLRARLLADSRIDLFLEGSVAEGAGGGGPG